MTENKEITNVQEEKAVNTFITEAIAKGLPVETMEKLFNLRKEVKAEYAREQFMKAMASFQKDCPIIVKTKGVKNKSGAEIYKYATLGDIVEKVKKPLGDNLLSYDFITEDLKDTLKVTCTVTHAFGHSKSSSFQIPIGTELYMTDPQKYGARLTFAKRYAFCNALGILTGETDTDVNEEKKEIIPVSVKAIEKLSQATNANELKEIWTKLSGKEKGDDEVVAYKEDLKRKLS
jgi:hypothetical protein